MVWQEYESVEKSALWFLGQSGFYLKSGGVSVVIDPYLSDCVGENSPLFTRIYPAPVSPYYLKADIYIVTHDHLDHLDPATIRAYSHKEETIFVAPRHAAKKLEILGINPQQIRIVDQGDGLAVSGVNIQGVFALGTDEGVLDTTGYRIRFENGKSVYHTSDTSFCDLLLRACPHVDVLLPCINGKFGNLTAEQAVLLTQAVNPQYVVPHHYDVMELNGENPNVFRYFCAQSEMEEKCRILKPLEMLEW